MRTLLEVVGVKVIVKVEISKEAAGERGQLERCKDFHKMLQAASGPSAASGLSAAAPCFLPGWS